VLPHNSFIPAAYKKSAHFTKDNCLYEMNAIAHLLFYTTVKNNLSMTKNGDCQAK